MKKRITPIKAYLENFPEDRGKKFYQVGNCTIETSFIRVEKTGRKTSELIHSGWFKETKDAL